MGHLLRRIGRAQRRALVFILCQIGGLPLTGARSYQFLASKSNIKAQGMGEHGRIPLLCVSFAPERHRLVLREC